MEKLMPYEILAFIFCCMDCYIVYKEKNPNTPILIWSLLLVGIFAGGVSIILMMHFAVKESGFLGILATIPALISLSCILGWQTATFKPGVSKYAIILSSVLIITAYVLCWYIGCALAPKHMYHG